MSAFSQIADIPPRRYEVRLVPCVDGSGLASQNFTSCRWSVRQCVRPVSAVCMTAGHNALRGSGPGQKPALDNALALMGYPHRRIDRLCITCCSPSQPSHHAGVARRDLVHAASGRFLVALFLGHHGPSHLASLLASAMAAILGWPPASNAVAKVDASCHGSGIEVSLPDLEAFGSATLATRAVASAGQCRNGTQRRLVALDRCQAKIRRSNSRISPQGPQLDAEGGDTGPGEIGNPLVPIVCDDRKQLFNTLRPTGATMPNWACDPNGIDHRGLLTDEELAGAVEHQATLLLGRLGLDKPHVGSSQLHRWLRRQRNRSCAA